MAVATILDLCMNNILKYENWDRNEFSVVNYNLKIGTTNCFLLNNRNAWAISVFLTDNKKWPPKGQLEKYFGIIKLIPLVLLNIWHDFFTDMQL